MKSLRKELRGYTPSGSKKGMTNFLIGSIIGLGVGGILLVLVAQLAGNVQTTQTVNSLPYNIAANVLSGFNQLGQLWPTIALTVGFIIVMGLLVGTLYSRLKGTGAAG